MENLYRTKIQYSEVDSIKDRMENSVIKEGMNSSENFNCNKSEGNIFYFSPKNKEGELIIIKDEVIIEL